MMKKIKRGKAEVQTDHRFSSGLKNEAGYVLIWVLILMVVAGLIIGPFLSFMITGLNVTLSYAETTASFYAADSGIEDAVYRIQKDYITTLRSDVGHWADTIPVESTALFPPQGVLLIEDEFINYTGIDYDNNIFTGVTREGEPWPPEHAEGTPVSLLQIGIPPSPANPDGVPWEYTLSEEVNGNQVDVTIESIWLLDSLEDPANGVNPHTELSVIGQVTELNPGQGYGTYRIDITYDGSLGVVKLDRIGVWLPPGFAYVSSEPAMTTLTQAISATQDYIPVTNTALFLPQGILRIEDELIQYTGIDSDNNQFTGCTRDIDMRTNHSANTLIYSQPVTTTLSADIDSDDTGIDVASTNLFPSAGVIRIEDELIQYDCIEFGELRGSTRGVSGTTPAGHLAGKSVTLVPLVTTLAQHIDDTQTSIEVVDSDLFPEEGVLRLDGELIRYDGNFSDTLQNVTRGINGTTATTHSRPVATTLTQDIDDDPTLDIIPVASTVDFPEQGTISIDSEVIRYTGRTGAPNPTFIVAPYGRGINGSSTASHNAATPVTSDGRLVIFKPITTTLTSDIDSVESIIPVVSTDQFPSTGVLSIDGELIRYDGKTSNQFTVANNGRGSDGTEATSHDSIALVTSYPKEISHKIGTALEWDFDSSGVNVEDLPVLTTPGGGLEPSTEYPIKRTLFITFTPAQSPRGIFSWIRTTRNDVYLSWDKSSAIYKLTATATDMTTGVQNTIESYTAKGRLKERVSQVFGDYRAIGNSLMYDTDNNTYRDTLLSSSSATITKRTPQVEDADIPADAKIEAAYLYWAAWWQQEAADKDVTLQVDGDPAMSITASKWSVLLHPFLPHDDVPDGEAWYAYACFTDVTDKVSKISTLGDVTYTITVGGVSADVDAPYPDGAVEQVPWSYAGWSLIIIYSSGEEDAHQLYLYDKFGHAYNTILYYPIEGFLAPSGAEGSITYFVGEGDDHITGDNIRFKAESDTQWHLLSNAFNPSDNVMNEQSKGLSVGGMDVDTFDVTAYLTEGDTSAQVEIESTGDGFDLVYLILSFQTDKLTESGMFPTGIITYSYGGG